MPQTQVVKTATMKLRYHFSPGLMPALSHLKVSLNGTLFATLAGDERAVPVADRRPTPTRGQRADDQSSSRATRTTSLLEATFTLPAEMLVHDNRADVRVHRPLHDAVRRPFALDALEPRRPNSTIELAGSLLPLQNDLKLLPLPFYDAAVNLHPVVPIVFLGQPSPKALQAAGIVASWFGILTDSRPVRFPVSIGTIPTGQCHRDRREFSGASRVAEDERELRPDDRDADQSHTTRTRRCWS